jgi:hypothetical protein
MAQTRQLDLRDLKIHESPAEWRFHEKYNFPLFDRTRETKRIAVIHLSICANLTAMEYEMKIIRQSCGRRWKFQDEK